MIIRRRRSRRIFQNTAAEFLLECETLLLLTVCLLACCCCWRAWVVICDRSELGSWIAKEGESFQFVINPSLEVALQRREMDF